MHKGIRPHSPKTMQLFVECLTLKYLLQKESCTVSISGVYLYPICVNHTLRRVWPLNQTD